MLRTVLHRNRARAATTIARMSSSSGRSNSFSGYSTNALSALASSKSKKMLQSPLPSFASSSPLPSPVSSVGNERDGLDHSYQQDWMRTFLTSDEGSTNNNNNKNKDVVDIEQEREQQSYPGYAPPGVDVMLMAVPKRKVTPSRKKRRNQFKVFEFVNAVRKCAECGRPMKSWHSYCCKPSSIDFNSNNNNGNSGGAEGSSKD